MKTSPLAAMVLTACAALPGETVSPMTLAKAEQAFAAQSVREDMRRAFLANFAGDGVMVRRGWVNAREWLQPRPAPPILLEWRPVHVEMARSGDLGLSTGPWRITPQGASAPAAYGQFVSIWTRAADGPWRVAVDIGISHPAPALWDTPLEARVSPGVKAGSPIAAAEAAFSEASSRSGVRAAWTQWSSSDLRAYREGLPPMLTRGDVSRRSYDDAKRAWVPDASVTAGSGELGYVRGHYGPADMPSKVDGYYLHVWRHEPAGWRLVVDVINPA